ncbi:hypothetical protein PanWU01x14_271220 [Parasponia andersonii]|uniref:Uncharacterized protein n=1 Tax=Parasponia andersonii TaxID=3476 RepID=A0A2P5B4W7_PARAD|nr:hypothetical protein PanWU01x14_271220 [Parasponia andersonii]
MVMAIACSSACGVCYPQMNQMQNHLNDDDFSASSSPSYSSCAVDDDAQLPHPRTHLSSSASPSFSSSSHHQNYPSHHFPSSHSSSSSTFLSFSSSQNLNPSYHHHHHPASSLLIYPSY